MTSEPLVLAFDTSAAHCAAALVCGETVLVNRVETMARGQAERLMPLLQNVLDDAKVSWADLDRLGVGVGPGNFTGIRISVSAARGLSLGLGIPAVGVSTFEATFFGVQERAVAIVSAPRDQLYVQTSDVDSQARLIKAPFDTDLPIYEAPDASQLVNRIACVARGRTAETLSRPAPLYIRAADAAPPRDLPPTIL